MPILDTSLHSLKRIYRGKVRDSYELDDDKLLIIATDRISAFDVILDDPIPYKGMVLQALTDFWFEKLKGIVPNHLTGIDPTTVVAEDEVDQVKGRSVVAMKLKPIPIECVVRGYIAGGGWKDYQATSAELNCPPVSNKPKNCRNRFSHRLPRWKLAPTMKIFLLNRQCN